MAASLSAPVTFPTGRNALRPRGHGLHLDRSDARSGKVRVSMSGLILHHYDFSNYSEKVRVALGYKSLEWSSVIVPPVIPKPDLTALTGGYPYRA
ncbi:MULTISPECIES: glutathione S-transferase N-terminal domain-containing protein [unclassified Bradyrhizobium]|uniref:glutathione S-transferase N-terminal domain-containing protein n=1 Tax=unclassified Bradyrhizobium TaxID=2631580 RepID=UPI0035C742D3